MIRLQHSRHWIIVGWTLHQAVCSGPSQLTGKLKGLSSEILVRWKIVPIERCLYEDEPLMSILISIGPKKNILKNSLSSVDRKNWHFFIKLIPYTGWGGQSTKNKNSATSANWFGWRSPALNPPKGVFFVRLCPSGPGGPYAVSKALGRCRRWHVRWRKPLPAV